MYLYLFLADGHSNNLHINIIYSFWLLQTDIDFCRKVGLARQGDLDVILNWQ